MNNSSPLITAPMQLADCFLFNGLSDDGLTAVCQSSKVRKVKAGEFFFHEGELAESFFVLLSGLARLLQTTPDGKQVIIHLCTPGHGMAIVAALGSARYPASAEAIKDSTAYVWDKQTLKRLMEEYPIIAINGMELLAKRFHGVQDRYREIATERVEQRVARTLLRLAEQDGVESASGIRIDMPLTRQDIAQMTGTTLYTVSRVLSKWEQVGLVNTGRQSVEIVSLQGVTIIAKHLKNGVA